jgi:hypothetical protein
MRLDCIMSRPSACKQLNSHTSTIYCKQATDITCNGREKQNGKRNVRQQELLMAQLRPRFSELDISQNYMNERSVLRLQFLLITVMKLNIDACCMSCLM